MASIPQDYHYTSQSGVYELSDPEGAGVGAESGGMLGGGGPLAEFQRVEQALEKIGVGPETREQVMFLTLIFLRSTMK